MDKQRIRAFYVLLEDGTCLFSLPISPMPESALITAMLSAMQSFIKEVSGTFAQKLSTGGFVFHIEKVGRVSFVLATAEEERPTTELTQLRTKFLHGYGQLIDDFRGVTDHFIPFEDDVKTILDISLEMKKTEPTKQLNSFALLQIKPSLQEIAREVILAKGAKPSDLIEKLDLTEYQVRVLLEELFDMGFIGRYIDGAEYVYFV